MNVTYRLHALVVGLALSGCGQPAPQPSAATLEPWPFTVDSVMLSCESAEAPQGASEEAAQILDQHGRRVFVTTDDGRRFAVNGSARAEAPLMTDIQTIVDTSDLIRRGLALCDQQGRSLRLARPTSAAQGAGSSPPPTYTIAPAEYGGGIVATAESDQLIEGQRVELTLMCERGEPPMIMLDLVSPPRTPPPLRGVYAVFEVDGVSERLEMSWATGSLWTLRSGDARLEDLVLARSILASEVVRFTGERQYMPSTALSWRPGQFEQPLLVECLSTS